MTNPSLSKDQVKAFKAQEKEAEHCWDYSSLADSLAEAGDKEWARKIYEKAVKTADDSQDLAAIGSSVLKEEHLSDMDWARDLYSQAVTKAENVWDITGVVDDIVDTNGLGDKSLAREFLAKAVDKAEDAADLVTVAQSVGREDCLGDKQWAKEICEKALDETVEPRDLLELSSLVVDDDAMSGKELTRRAMEKALGATSEVESILEIANFVSAEYYLNDKTWARQILEVALSEAEDAAQMRAIADTVQNEDSIGDKDWAETIHQKSRELSEEGIALLDRHLKRKPTKCVAGYAVWENEKQEGTFTVLNEETDEDEKIDGYRIWENKSGVTLTWNLPGSSADAIRVLENMEWSKKDLVYDEMEGLEHSEGKSISDYQVDDSMLEETEDFDGEGFSETVDYGSLYGPGEITIYFDDGEEVSLRATGAGPWEMTLPGGETVKLAADEDMMNAVKKLFSAA